MERYAGCLTDGAGDPAVEGGDVVKQRGQTLSDVVQTTVVLIEGLHQGPMTLLQLRHSTFYPHRRTTLRHRTYTVHHRIKICLD